MSVVDEQQRLTTNYKAYCNHPDLKNVVLDLGKGEFVINIESCKKNQILVGILLNKMIISLLNMRKEARCFHRQ